MKIKVSILTIIVLLVLSISIFAASENISEEDAWIRVDNEDEAVTFSGVWNSIADDKAYQGSEKTDWRTGSFAEFEFTGTDVRWLGSKARTRGEADVYLNEEKIDNVNNYSEETEYQEVIFSLEDLEPKTHTLKVDPTNSGNEEVNTKLVAIDAFEYIPTMEKAIELTKKELLAAQAKPEELGDKLASYATEKSKEKLISLIAEKEFKNSIQDVEKMDIAHLNQAKNSFIDNKIAPEFPDLSQNDYKGMVKGTAHWVEGKKDKAIDFEKSGLLDSEVTASEMGLEGTNTKTIEAWAYTRDFNGGGIFQMGSVGEDGTDFSLRTTETENQWRGQFWAFDTDFEYESKGEWVHFALVHKGDGMKIYANGELVAENEEDLNTGDETTFSIGGWDPEENGEYFDGIIDEVRVWNYDRSQEEIEQTMDESLSGEEEGLVLYWTFDELD
ncbi:MAG: LamG domain-containing protein [bacterium]